jgi:hypothetical protein
MMEQNNDNDEEVIVMEYTRYHIQNLFRDFCEDENIQYKRMTDEQFKYWQDRFYLYFQDAVYMAFRDMMEEG